MFEAGTGTAALRLLHGGTRIDLLITDLGLPGEIDGRRVAEEARCFHPALPVIVTTGLAPEDTLPPGMEVLQKPYRARLLVDRVRSRLKG